ncbi:hypothetical protein PFAG_03395 [Plasmodium falciparum Santa Lucia]|uniref:Uncharacterized protein n=1 Tax=Plasmodium falciparum Santa Lucia TaxID=478859 RepID=W7FSY2_PLAFA|nr:hypothetical protein PFAG_03395 [Plasmodium falciparum Santa Lucia]
MPWFLPFRKLFLNINVHNDNIIKKKKKRIKKKKKKKKMKNIISNQIYFL